MDYYDYVAKYILIGDCNTGKTNILYKYIEDKIHSSYLSTIGVDLFYKIIRVNNLYIKLQIWDTAGTERFRSITQNYYRDTAVVFLVFSLENSESFHNLQEWYNEFLRANRDNSPIVYLIGNKSDLLHAITKEQIQEFMNNNDIQYYYETSIYTNTIQEIFHKSAVDVYKKINSKNFPVGVRKNLEELSHKNCVHCTIM